VEVSGDGAKYSREEGKKPKEKVSNQSPVSNTDKDMDNESEIEDFELQGCIEVE